MGPSSRSLRTERVPAQCGLASSGVTVQLALTAPGPGASCLPRRRNWAAGVPPEKCSRGTEGHNTASIGGFVMLPPVVLSALRQGVDAAQAAAVEHLALTHESKALAQYAQVG